MPTSASARPAPKSALSQAAAPRRVVVVKVGSAALVDDAGMLRRPFVAELAQAIVAARREGTGVVLVSSGAIAMGYRRLGFEHKPVELPKLQACAAVGQSLVIHGWSEVFDWLGVCAGQVLLTHDDITNRTRYLNARDTLRAMIAQGAVPVINENDTVAVDEIKFGDNDLLAARVAALVDASLLVLFSDVPGLLDRAPGDPAARVVPEVHEIDEALLDAVTTPGSRYGTGGMRAKLLAARRAREAGIPTVIGGGRDAAMLHRLLAGEAGTRVHADLDPVVARKRWLLAQRARPEDALLVDAGCERALVRGGKSLLASGIVGVSGDFRRGDCVTVRGADGREVGRGFVEYAASEIARIKGLASRDIASVLGFCLKDEVVHRDNLVVHGTKAVREAEAAPLGDSAPDAPPPVSMSLPPRSAP